MLEGGGKTPILSPAELEKIGFSLVVYPLSLVGVSMRAMQVCILMCMMKHVTLFFISELSRMGL
jgi:2-methylisocitrate lyase-like PEP mutase family enzyme